MKRRTRIFLVMVILLLAAVSGYLALAFYYRGVFSLNTWINGVYCTGKSVEEVNSELLSFTEAPIITITDSTGQSYLLDLSQADYKGDYTESLEESLKEQNSFLWAGYFTAQRNTLAPAVSFDEEKLEKLWQELPFVRQELEREPGLSIERRDEGYTLIDGLSGRLDTQKAYQALLSVIKEGETQLSLGDADCYYALKKDEQDEQTLKLWKKIEQFQDCQITYDMGDKKILLDASITAGFLKTEYGLPVLDESGELVMEKEQVEAFIKELAGEYDTYGGERSFLSTRGDVVTIEGGTYGTQLDQKAEVEYLMESIPAGESCVHIPAYKRQGLHRGKDDIGDTYIEIDMTQQKMYYYEEGELLLETEVVTGNLSRKWGTPEGVNYVYNKQRNRVLRGEGYASPVKYWMPVKGGIGIHDASWRTEFGGEIYKKNGSHGCINTPSQKMAELYEMVETGTPVVMFY